MTKKNCLALMNKELRNALRTYHALSDISQEELAARPNADHAQSLLRAGKRRIWIFYLFDDGVVFDSLPRRSVQVVCETLRHNGSDARGGGLIHRLAAKGRRQENDPLPACPSRDLCVMRRARPARQLCASMPRESPPMGRHAGPRALAKPIYLKIALINRIRVNFCFLSQMQLPAAGRALAPAQAPFCGSSGFLNFGAVSAASWRRDGDRRAGWRRGRRRHIAPCCAVSGAGSPHGACRTCA